MTDRSKEELQQIYNDLLEFRETLNWLDSFGALAPIPMNGKSWNEEKEQFYDRGITALRGLIASGKVTSCECITILEKENRRTERLKNREGFWKHIGMHMANSNEYKIGEYSVEQILRKLEVAIEGKAPIDELKRLNEIFDEIGTAACAPRACIPINEFEGSFGSNLTFLSMKLESTSNLRKL